MFRRLTLVLLLMGFCLGSAADSVWVYPASDGHLLYKRDSLGNRIPDFSNVGYRGGGAPIPEVPVRVTISPVAGDDGDSIQGAIDEVSALPLDANGFRGAVLLQAGEYQIADHIEIRANGVVLRGVGDSTSGTVLRASSTGQRTLVRVLGSGSRSTVSGTTRNVTDGYVPVGARSFTISSTSGYAAGDRVIAKRPSTQAWIDELGMDQLENPWTPGSRDIQSDRIVTRIEGNRIFLNAPLVCALDQRYGGGQIWKYTWSARIRNVGVEHIRGVSDYAATDDENHGWIFVEFRSCEDCWARDLTSQYFGYACVGLFGGAQAVTVADCESLDPISQVTGGRRYAFVVDDAELCLVRNCRTHQDRHQFVTQSNTDGPNAFVDGVSDSARSDAGPHHRWATGALWDHIEVNGHALNIQNRGNLGSGHGWAGGNCVAWNCDASSGFVVQNPPTARNWLIGSIGAIKNGTVHVGPHDPGTYDANGTNVFPQSLYHNQLNNRLIAPGLQIREYVVGDMDEFSSTNIGGGSVTVDSTWLAQVTAQAGGAANVTNFDALGGNKWIPWTHSFQLDPGDRIVSAVLWISVRGIGSGWASDEIFFDTLANNRSITNFAPTIGASGSTVLTIDLADQLALLADGRLNLAVQDDLAVDWSALELGVAATFPTLTNVLVAEADAFVRGGSFAANNFGTAATLTTKEDANDEFTRRAFLRWDLTGVAGKVVHARVRLTPVSTGQTGNENGAAIAASDVWTETGLTWNNQPGRGYRLVSWLPQPGQPVEFAVTPQVEEALAGGRKLSLSLFAVRNFGGAGTVDYASRQHADPSSRPQLILTISNSPPAITDLLDQFTPTNTQIGPVPFTIGDAETPAEILTLSATSSNPALVPLANILFSGTGSNRFVEVTPSGSTTGAVTITITVSDGILSASDAFHVHIGQSNSPPVLSQVANRAISEDASTGPIPFTVGDAELAAASLIVTAASSNEALVSSGGIILGGTGVNRNVTLTPNTNAHGSALITISVSDGSLATNHTFTLTVTPVNDPPDFVALTSPADGARFTIADTLFLAADTTDPDGNLARVDFLANGTPLTRDTTSPYRFGWSNLGLGTFALQAVAADANGLTVTSAPVLVMIEPARQVLVPFGATWRYLDSGTAPPANWIAAAYHDGAWSSGPAELGYGDDDEATVISFGPSETNKFITTWFRHAFVVPELPDADGLLLRLIRDDGVVVYLNGTEIFRNNLPAGTITAATRAQSGITGAAETNIVATAIPLAAVPAGANLLAVEMHQNSLTSSDLSFDLELSATNIGISAIVAAGSAWRYLDTGADLGTAWRAPGFNDSGWSNGLAQLGFGDGDEATVLTNNLQTTTYFRRVFQLTHPEKFPAAFVRLLRDDGAVIYLNGAEIFRSNLPTNAPILFDTFALDGVTDADEDAWHTNYFDSRLLRAGPNVLAVEIHQNQPNSSDISFDLELVGLPAAALPRLTASAEGSRLT
ncbi:MAG TPA: DNRLRE domain-containing protein, partial [Verrucomicrobiae bacterium]|nr:DNRLRE domain-containing protein [Verrucomicrobiae bacterium]